METSVRLFTQTEVTLILGIAQGTLLRAVDSGELAIFITVGKRNLYEKNVIMAFAEKLYEQKKTRAFDMLQAEHFGQTIALPKHILTLRKG